MTPPALDHVVRQVSREGSGRPVAVGARRRESSFAGSPRPARRPASRRRFPFAERRASALPGASRRSSRSRPRSSRYCGFARRRSTSARSASRSRPRLPRTNGPARGSSRPMDPGWSSPPGTRMASRHSGSAISTRSTHDRSTERNPGNMASGPRTDARSPIGTGAIVAKKAKTIAETSEFNLVLMSDNADAMKAAIETCGFKRPLCTPLQKPMRMHSVRWPRKTVCPYASKRIRWKA